MFQSCITKAMSVSGKTLLLTDEYLCICPFFSSDLQTLHVYLHIEPAVL